MTWRPRPSAIGGYIECDYRAAFDRAIEENPNVVDLPLAEVNEARKSSPYADLGTCIHFVLQDGLRGVFPSDASEHEPTKEQWANASTLFDCDLTRTAAAVRAAATLAAHKLPKPGDGKPWLVEHEFPDPLDLTHPGHIDFLSHDHLDLWDLKTTTKPPAHMRIKPSHLHQLLTYRRCAGNKPKRGGILYVDSQRASWALAVEIDFESPEMLELAEHTASYTAFLRSEHLMKMAVPRIGTHCSENFCPYVAGCKNRYIPASTKIHESSPLVAPRVEFTV